MDQTPASLGSAAAPVVVDRLRSGGNPEKSVGETIAQKVVILRGVSPRVASPEFVGRAQELSRLTAAAGAAGGGTPGCILIGGESGVGKSRLVNEFAVRAAADGARVLAGDCVDLGDAELAYAPLVGALRDVEAEELHDLLGTNARELARLLPQLEGPDASQSATVSNVSGATYTTDAYLSSLQSALDQAAS